MQGSLVEWLTMLGEWGIVGAILYEGHVALKEYRSARLFDAIKYIEDMDARRARTTLYKQLHDTPPESHEWWKENSELESAAAVTCARYNLLGAVTREDKVLRQFVVREWGNNICWTFEALKNYVKYREHSKTGRPRMSRHYAALYEEARQQQAS
ncbi:MAG: hypothetical protein QOJ96_419 [Alphaproteobacteria bacterium]|jgi:hypothetical protein|nr:hypothetical protein [Alphaproteobacteria bacterium]